MQNSNRTRIRRLVIAGLASSVMVGLFGSVAWWATEPLRPPRDLREAARSIRSDGSPLADLLDRRAGRSPTSPAPVQQYLSDRRLEARSRMLVGALAGTSVGVVVIWGAIVLDGRVRRSPATALAPTSGEGTPSVRPIEPPCAALNAGPR